MKRLLNLLIFIFIGINANYAQAFVVNMKLANCVSCYQHIIKLKDVADYPKLIVFKNELRKDSVDLVHRYKLDKLDLSLIFNDSLFDMTLAPGFTSTVSLLLPNGKLSWKVDLARLSNESFLIGKIKDIQTISPLKREIIEYKNGYTFIFDLNTSVLRYYKDDDTNNIVYSKAYKLKTDEVFRHFPNDERATQIEYWEKANENPLLANSYSYFDLDSAGNAYILYQYHGFCDTSKKQLQIFEESNICRNYSIVRNDIKTNQREVFPVMFDKYHNYHVGFHLVKDKNTIYFLTTDATKNIRKQVKDSTEKIYNLSEFKLSNGQYKFIKRIPIDLPKPYRNKYLYNDFSLNFSEYPILAYVHDTVVYHIETGLRINVLKGNHSVDENDMTNSYKSYILFHVYPNVNNNTVLVSYRYKGAIYIARFDMTSGELIRRTDISVLLPFPIDQSEFGSYVLHNQNKKAVQIYVNGHDVIGLPTFLF